MTHNVFGRTLNLTQPINQPIGPISLFCCTRYDVPPSEIARVGKSFVWARHRSSLTQLRCCTVFVLLELLSNSAIYTVSCLFRDDITHSIDYI